MKFYSLRYSLRVWLSSVMVAPLIYIIIQSYTGADKFNSDAGMGMYPIIVLIEVMFSFATWLVFWGITELTAIYLTKPLIRKWLLFGVAMLATIGTFLLIARMDIRISIHDITFDMMLSNCLCIGAGCWFFSLGPPITLQFDSTIKLK